jgi:streptogramin lyase
VSSGRTIGPIAGKTLPGPVPLPEPASIVEIGPDGEVWAGCPGFTMATGCLQTIAHFDGRTWETLEPPPLTDGAFLRDLEVTPQGDVWITAVETTDDGRSMMTPARYRDGTWTELVATDTGVPLDSLFEGYTAAAIESTPDGSLLLVSHDGVFTLEQDRWVRVATGAFSDLSVAPDGAVWLGGDGIFRLRDERP